MNRYYHYMLLFLFIVTVAHSASIFAQTLTARTGNVILANGFFSKSEWADASHIIVNERVVLYAKHDRNYIYIGIKTIDTTHTGLDLYIASGESKRILLHVSSALAQATYENGIWSEWQWEQNQKWIANKIGLYYDGEIQHCSEPEGFEFQIDKNMIDGKVIYLAMHLKRPEYLVPSLKDRESFNNWIQLIIKS